MMNKYILFVIFYAFIATQSVGGRINVKQNENSTLIVTTPGATTTGAMLTPGATTPGATTTGAMLTPGATTPGATTTGAMLTPGATTPGATTTGAMLTTPGVSKAPTLKFSTTTGYEYPCYKGSCYNDDYCCGGICCAVCINLVCQNCLPSASQCTYNSDCCSNICYNFYCLITMIAVMVFIVLLKQEHVKYALSFIF
uniref:Uncharacterized protein n=1 Tax=Acrobeloides nanus TaxID=290746 RepID=A0A914D4Z0_9BILA